MSDNSPHPNNEAFVEGNNSLSSTPIPIPENVESSHLGLEQNFEVTYDQL